MNLETINKWLDEEYGCSYTNLEELHDWLAEENIKLKEVKKENQQLKKQKDDVVEAIKGILEINNNYSVEKLAPFYSRKWLEDTHTDLLRMLGEEE